MLFSQTCNLYLMYYFKIISNLKHNHQILLSGQLSQGLHASDHTFEPIIELVSFHPIIELLSFHSVIELLSFHPITESDTSSFPPQTSVGSRAVLNIIFIKGKGLLATKFVCNFWTSKPVLFIFQVNF